MTQKLKITGMTCAHCVRAVTGALEKVKRVSRAQVSLERGEAVVQGDAPAPELIAAVESEGYEAQVAE